MTAIALATFIAAPAFAKTVAHKHSSAPSTQGQSTQGLYNQAAPAFGGAPFGGQDPSANVRSELQRDYGQSMGAY